jgi:myo-inositol-1(or 4)-monophosphatase
MPDPRGVLFEALREAGDVIRRGLHRPKHTTFKDSPINLVTAVDRASEKLIVKIIKKHFPDHNFLTEEGTVPTPSLPPRGGGCRMGGGFKWIVDPLDGTTNYAHSFPQVAVSIGLEKDGKMKLGGVYDPFREELFFAEKGRGAYLKTRRSTVRLAVSGTKHLDEALLLTGFPYDRRQRADFYLKFVAAFMKHIQGIRRAGAAALDLCWVACGRVDGYWEWRLKPWDVAAGSLIVEEAGGRMTDFLGKPFNPYGIQTLASNARIHKEMLKVLKKAGLKE